MSQPVKVACRPEAARWVCSVTVGDEAAATHHEVTVSRDLLAELRPGAEGPDDLIRDSFSYDHVQIFLMDANDIYAELRASTGEAGKQLLSINHKLAKGSASVIGTVLGAVR